MTRLILLPLLLSVLVSCASKPTGSYAPPQSQDLERTTITIRTPFDQVWDNLIAYAADSFFSIQHYEKDSGLIVLTFGDNNIENFITGGQFQRTAYTGLSARGWGEHPAFSGDWVSLLEHDYNAALNGTLNVVVQPRGGGTQVTVKARYTLQFDTGDHESGWSLRDDRYTLKLETGTCIDWLNPKPTGQTPSKRTVCPTYRVERAIFENL
ncbi:MAG: hypothetical protein AAF442_05205 [Pseudomonadota bacterium]